MEEEVKRCEYNHERILSELQAGHERSREEISEEMNKLNLAARELSVEKEKLRKKLDKILRSARKMKHKYKQKLTQFEESINICRAERDKVSICFFAEHALLSNEIPHISQTDIACTDTPDLVSQCSMCCLDTWEIILASWNVLCLIPV